MEPAATAALQHDAASVSDLVGSDRCLRPRGRAIQKSSQRRSTIDVVSPAPGSRAQMRGGTAAPAVKGQSSCSSRACLPSSQRNKSMKRSQQDVKPQRTKKVRKSWVTSRSF
jgi:hypothetical protein